MTITETLLDRFKTAVKFLIDNKIVGLQKDVAIKCEVSPNYLSGVLRDRIELKGKFLDKFVSELPINPSYIVGISDEIYLHSSKPQNQEGKEEPQKSDVFSHTEVIKLISKIKSNSTSAADKTQAAEQLNEIVAQLVDENSTLKTNLMGKYQNTKQ